MNKKQQINPFQIRKFKKLFDELYVPLCRYSMTFVRDKDVAEDIVQDQFVNFWNDFKRLNQIDLPKNYLYKMVKNKSLNYINKWSNRNILGEDSITETLEPVDQLPPPDKLLENKELLKIINKAIESLPINCRNIFVMKRFGELTNSEIAGKLNISVKTVEAQITIAFKKLRSFIANNWEISILLLFLF